MAFHDVQLPIEVERGAQGGPGFNTTILTLSSGLEQRNINWSTTRGKWDISYGIQTKADFTTVIDFFYAREGRAHSFRFKDWSDFVIGVDSTDTTQSIGTGDAIETVFQIFKRYTSGSINFDRDITKIVSATLRVFVNAVEQTLTTHYTFDALTGLITFVTAPPDTQDVAVITEFDVPVRFDNDQLQVSVITFDAGALPGIDLVEVKGE